MTQETQTSLETFSPRDGVTLAYHRNDYAKNADSADCLLPGVVFMGGFKSDMTGTKATFLEQHCTARQQPFVRFDYQGHGASSGTFTEGNISLWLQDALDVLDTLTSGPQILVGSSMGGWISLLTALQRKERIAGVIGLAPAPDFTKDIFEQDFTEEQRKELTEAGMVSIPNEYGDPYIITRQFFEDGDNHLLLHDSIAIDAPVRLIHGKQDPDVPWQKSERILERLSSQDKKIIWIEDGDHRLSRDQDLAIIDKTVMELTDLFNTR